MKAAAEAIVELARDPRYVGGTVGVLAVLHKARLKNYRSGRAVLV
jgi:hypothetical protein